MASGLPVIGTAVDGVREQLTESTGVLVDPDDAEALARAVLDLADDPAARARLGKAARRRVEENFTLEVQAQGLNDAYVALLDR
jgi:glycosyltransferase involved in cell wall biosynthesis